MGIGFESGISQSVGSSVGGLQGGARFLTPPSGIPIPPEPLPPVPAGIAAGALSLLAPVAAFFGAFFLFPGAAGDPNEAKNLRQPVYNPNTGNKSIGVSYTVGLYVQDFVNGCDDGLYELFYDYGLAYDSLPSVSFELVSSYPSCGGTSGSIRKFIANGEDTGFRPQGIEMSLIPIGFKKGGDRPSVFYGWRKIGSGGATPPTPIAPPIETVPSGYTGTGGVTPEEKAKKILPAKIASTLGTSGVKSFGAVGGGSPSLSGGRNYTPSDLLPPANPQSPPLTSPPQSPVQTPPSTPPLQKPTPPLEKPKAPLDPLKPYEPNPNDLTGQLASIGSILGVMNNNVTDIKNNTTPENQQANAKTGACNALNSPSCTKQMEDNIKNPLNQNIDAARNTLAANQFGQDLAFKGLFDNFTKLFSFLDNQYVDRALGVVNAGLNLHNALMLSNALGKTAAGIIDNVINLNPSWRFVDSKGQQTTASRAFGQNIEAFFINIIGLENYTNLQDFLAVENRIIRSSTNLLNRTESLFAKSAKVGQRLGGSLGDLCNAMLVNGVISPSSYPKKAASKAANDALDSDTASDISSAASGVSSTLKNLKTITGEVLTVTRNAQKISTEFTKLTALFNADSKVRKDLRIQIATKAKKRSIYTIVDIKQIKINADKRPNSKPLR